MESGPTTAPRREDQGQGDDFSTRPGVFSVAIPDVAMEDPNFTTNLASSGASDPRSFQFLNETISRDQTSEGYTMQRNLAALRDPAARLGNDGSLPTRQEQSTQPQFGVNRVNLPAGMDSAEYRRQLELLEAQSRKRLDMARREQEQISEGHYPAYAPYMPGSDYGHKRKAIKRSLENDSSDEDPFVLIKKLRSENEQLRCSLLGKSTWKILHAIGDQTYLDAPSWDHDSHPPALRSTGPLRDRNLYLEEHPEIAFVFLKEYDPDPKRKQHSVNQKQQDSPENFRESMTLLSKHVISAVHQLKSLIPGFEEAFPYFDAEQDVDAPYLFVFYSLPFMDNILEDLEDVELEALQLLVDAVKSRYGNEYERATELAAAGMTTKSLFPYVIRPGDTLFSNIVGSKPAVQAASWASAKNKEDEWAIEVWSWGFNGAFRRKNSEIIINLSKKKNGDEPFSLRELEYFPLRYVDKGEITALLKKRGQTFWSCRKRRLISYREGGEDITNDIEERYMIDAHTYNMLHGKGREPVSPAFESQEMDNSDVPEVGQYLFPPTIKGYNLRLKKWVVLKVDHISDVVWNKEAFKNLVVDGKTKELIEALITNSVSSPEPADFVQGKGNGLVLLLHGGPGVGKTFTAEGVAEIAEKPLYRVTCGDIGTKPEEVEKYLNSVFHLGKIWDCVVLLDEADIFLEERSLSDLQRNSLVSVFLRILEYNAGILILTSNRVGTFDEAFKSRIQLALHYKNLTPPQQKRIWTNFIGQIQQQRLQRHNSGTSRQSPSKKREENEEREEMNVTDIYAHLDEIIKHNDMNGRQIRNVLTTARNLARFKRQVVDFKLLSHVIEVSRDFEKYLIGLNEDFSDDERMRDAGVR